MLGKFFLEFPFFCGYLLFLSLLLTLFCYFFQVFSNWSNRMQSYFRYKDRKEFVLGAAEQ